MNPIVATFVSRDEQGALMKALARLVLLSTDEKQIFVHSGHNMDVDAPNDVTAVIRDVVEGPASRKAIEFSCIVRN